MSKTARFALCVLRLGIGALFIYASADKIIHPDRFADIAHEFQLIPEGLVNLVAVTLPWIELSIGTCLVAGIWVPSASLISVGLTVAFMAGIVWGMSQGIEDFHCGCFSTAQDTADDPWQVLGRDTLLLAATVWLFVAAAKSERLTPRPSRRQSQAPEQPAPPSPPSAA